MQIDRITLHHLRMPLVAPFETSFGRITDRECILIEVRSQPVARLYLHATFGGTVEKVGAGEIRAWHR